MQNRDFIVLPYVENHFLPSICISPAPDVHVHVTQIKLFVKFYHNLLIYLPIMTHNFMV